MECVICGGHSDPIGCLGGVEWFRCRQCGMDNGVPYDADIADNYVHTCGIAHDASDCPLNLPEESPWTG